MSHFFGYMLKQEQVRGDECENFQQIALNFLARSGPKKLETYLEDNFWLVTLPTADSEGTPALRTTPNGIVVSAGNILKSENITEGQDVISQPKLLSEFFGHFSYGQYDIGKRELLLATDHLGIRGLYYFCNDKYIIFSTSFSLLAQCLGKAAQTNKQGLAEKLFLGFSLADRTVIDGIKRLMPGCCAIFKANLAVSVSSYISYYNNEVLDLPFEEHLFRVKEAFSKSVSRRRTQNSEECFLSGGMDSRAIVAELFNQQAGLRTFCSGYKNSSDHILSDIIAKKFGTEHCFHERTPAQRVYYAQDPFAFYAREHFPTKTVGIRAIWSGDGGGVIGNIQLNEEKISLCSSKQFNEDSARRLYPKLNLCFTKIFSATEMSELSELAVQGIVSEFAKLASVPAQNRFRIFYLKNHQPRHLFEHFESIDLHQTELVLPFFDSELVKIVLQVPPEFLLRHRFYNQWLKAVSPSASSVYWQSYPGHESCSLPRPSEIKDQWDKDWYTSAEVSSAYLSIATEMLGRPLYPSRFRTRVVLMLAACFAFLGSVKMRHEINLARSLSSIPDQRFK